MIRFSLEEVPSSMCGSWYIPTCITGRTESYINKLSDLNDPFACFLHTTSRVEVMSGVIHLFFYVVICLKSFEISENIHSAHTADDFRPDIVSFWLKFSSGKGKWPFSIRNLAKKQAQKRQRIIFKTKP